MKNYVRPYGIYAAFAVAALLQSFGAMADGNSLLRSCQATVVSFDSDGSQGNDFDSGYCIGVLNGVSSMSELLNGAIHKTKQFCLPKITNIQGARIIVKYLTDHPTILHFPDGYAVLGALQDAYPCNNNE